MTAARHSSLRLHLERLEERLLLDSTGTVGGGVPLDVTTPALAVHYIIALQGVFPARTGAAVNDQLLGEVRLYASNTTEEGAPMRSWAYCDGQQLPISQNQALFSILGRTFGGSGDQFALPDLRGRAAVDAGPGPGLPAATAGKLSGAETVGLTLQQVPTHSAPLPDGGVTGAVGGGQPLDLTMPQLGINYLIATSQDTGLAGELRLFAGSFAPAGWQFCAGQLLATARFPELFAALGTTYGGDGKQTFALPDLRGRMAIGADAALPVGSRAGALATRLTTAELPVHSYPLPGGGSTGPVGGGQPLATTGPALAVNYVIALVGVFAGTGNGIPALSEIAPFAGAATPVGWALCDGALLQISENQALFSLIGTTYGGDGTATFALPDLRGRVPVEAGQGLKLTDRTIGAVFGGGTVGVANLPPESLALPVLTVTVKADSPSVAPGGKAGFTLTIANTGAKGTVAAGLALADPLPNLGGATLWTITGGASAKSFTLTGPPGDQQLALAPGATALTGGAALVVHVAGTSAASGAFSSVTLVDTATLHSPDVTASPVTSSASVLVNHRAPVLAGLEGAPLAYHAGTPVALTGALTIADADSATLTGATIAFAKGFQPVEDVLHFADQNGIAGNYDSAHGILTLTGTASVAAYQQALRSVTYQDGSTTPATAPRTVTFQVTDGALNHAGSNVVARGIKVGAHLPPVLAHLESAILTDPTGGPITVTSTLTIADGAAATLASATVAITSGRQPSEDVLACATPNGLSVHYEAASGVLTLTGMASLASYQAALRSVTYQSSAGTPTKGTRTLAFQVDDGFGVANLSLPLSRKVTV